VRLIKPEKERFVNIVTPEEVGLSSTRLEHLSTAAQGYVDQGKLAGLITMVARHGKVAHLECYGMMDIEAEKPMQPDAIFRIYSMTKPITCFALMMLIEEGLIALNDPVTKFIPEFEMLKDLLTHTSGLSYDAIVQTPLEDMYREAGIFDSLHVLQVSLQDMLKILAELPLGFQPGSEFRYSMAHDVIGYLVGLVSDLPFDTFLEERIFRPLGMIDTGFYVPREKLDRFAAMYSPPGDDGIRLVDAPATSPFSRPDRAPSGGVGLVSTTSDYLRFAQMVLNGGELEGVCLLRRETVQMMTTNQLPDELVPIFSLPGLGYGFGFGVHMGPDRTRDLGLKGTFLWDGHAGTSFCVDPNEALISFIMPQALDYYGFLDPLRELVNQTVVD
jgi:CubicO group peptidase (beta-lactamase class C family)